MAERNYNYRKRYHIRHTITAYCNDKPVTWGIIEQDSVVPELSVILIWIIYTHLHILAFSLIACRLFDKLPSQIQPDCNPNRMRIWRCPCRESTLRLVAIHRRLGWRMEFDRLFLQISIVCEVGQWRGPRRGLFWYVSNFPRTYLGTWARGTRIDRSLDTF